MPRLKELFLCDTEVTDAVLESIEHFTQLELLFLRSAKITDAGLNRLKGLVLLRRLYLGGTQVSDAGLENLKGLTRLDTLELRGTRVTDAVLENIKGLSHLRIFDLQRDAYYRCRTAKAPQSSGRTRNTEPGQYAGYGRWIRASQGLDQPSGLGTRRFSGHVRGCRKAPAGIAELPYRKLGDSKLDIHPRTVGNSFYINSTSG